MKQEFGNLMAEDPQQETINLLNYRLNAVTIERDEWKAKFIQQNKDLGCEMMDPNGTIWDHAKKLQGDLAAVTEQRDGLRAGIDCASDQLRRVTEQRDKALQKIKNQAERIAYLEGATNHATGTPLSKAIEQRDRLAAGLEVAQQVGIQLGEQRDRLAEALRQYEWPCSNAELAHYCASASSLFSVEAQREMKRRKALQSLNPDHTVDANDMIADVKGGSDDFDQFRPFDF